MRVPSKTSCPLSNAGANLSSPLSVVHEYNKLMHVNTYKPIFLNIQSFIYLGVFEKNLVVQTLGNDFEHTFSTSLCLDATDSAYKYA